MKSGDLALGMPFHVSGRAAASEGVKAKAAANAGAASNLKSMSPLLE